MAIVARGSRMTSFLTRTIAIAPDYCEQWRSSPCENTAGRLGTVVLRRRRYLNLKEWKKDGASLPDFLTFRNSYADAHTVVTNCIVYKGIAVPYPTSLFFSDKVYPELAAEMIESLEILIHTKVVVLFDKYFLGRVDANT